MLEYRYTDGRTLVCSPECQRFARHTCQDWGELWETEQPGIFCNHIQRYKNTANPWIFLDIGAQVGLYAVYVGKRFPSTVALVAFEAFPDAIPFLRETLALNNIPQCTVVPRAVSNVSQSSVSFQSCLSHNGLHTLGAQPHRFHDVHPISVETTTLDDHFSENPEDRDPVHALKIDTEGWEYFILEGARRLIETDRPLIQLEWNETNMAQCSVCPAQLEAWIQEHRYHRAGTFGEDIILVPVELLS